jgi:hypothetical protein
MIKMEKIFKFFFTTLTILLPAILYSQIMKINQIRSISENFGFLEDNYCLIKKEKSMALFYRKSDYSTNGKEYMLNFNLLHDNKTNDKLNVIYKTRQIISPIEFKFLDSSYYCLAKCAYAYPDPLEESFAVLIKVSKEGNTEWAKTYPIVPGGINRINNELVLTGTTRFPIHKAQLFCLNDKGEVKEKLTYFKCLFDGGTNGLGNDFKLQTYDSINYGFHAWYYYKDKKGGDLQERNEPISLLNNPVGEEFFFGLKDFKIDKKKTLQSINGGHLYLHVIPNSKLGDLNYVAINFQDSLYSNGQKNGFTNLVIKYKTKNEKKILLSETRNVFAHNNLFYLNNKVLVFSKSRDEVTYKLFDLSGKLIEEKKVFIKRECQSIIFYQNKEQLYFLAYNLKENKGAYYLYEINW